MTPAGEPGASFDLLHFKKLVVRRDA